MRTKVITVFSFRGKLFWDIEYGEGNYELLKLVKPDGQWSRQRLRLTSFLKTVICQAYGVKMNSTCQVDMTEKQKQAAG